VFSRRIVGWALATHMRTDLPLEALEMAIWTRQGQVDGLIQHTDAGSQYLAIRYADTLAAAGALPSVGTVGDSYDTQSMLMVWAAAESTIGQLKAELIHRRGPWRTVAQLEYAVFEYLDWWKPPPAARGARLAHPGRKGDPALRSTTATVRSRFSIVRVPTGPSAVQTNP